MIDAEPSASAAAAHRSGEAHDTSRTSLARLAKLRARIRPERSTYHAFQHRERRILYDLCSGTVLQLSPAAFALLHGIEQDHADERVLAALLECTAETDLVLTEIEQLAALGFFELESIESAAQRDETVRAHTEHHPNKMMLMIQTSCNLKCTYCYEVKAGFHSTGTSMDYETGKRAVEHMISRSASRPHVEITFFGGEPLINFRLMKQLVDYCELRSVELGKEFSYQITTNAVLMTDEVIDFLIEHRFGVMVSIDGRPEKADVHRRDLGGKGSTARAVANARRLVARQKQAGLRPALIRATMTPENSDAIDIADYLTENGFERQMIGGSGGRAHEKGAGDLGDADRAKVEAGFLEELDRYLAWVDGAGPKPLGGSVERSLGKLQQSLDAPGLRPGIGCGVGRNMQAIAEDGSIYPCHRYAGEKAWVIGTLEQGLDPVKTEGYYRALLANYDATCAGCVARFVCGGQCPWYISRPDGHVGTPDDASCDAIRRGLELQLWMLVELRSRAAKGRRALRAAEQAVEGEQA